MEGDPCRTPQSRGPQLTVLSCLNMLLASGHVCVCRPALVLPVWRRWLQGQVSALCCVTVGKVTMPSSQAVGRSPRSPGECTGLGAGLGAGCPSGGRLHD